MSKEERYKRFLEDMAAILGCKPEEVGEKIKAIQAQQS